jgi:hypothetical protein
MLTAAINSACARQFERLQLALLDSDSSLGGSQEEVQNLGHRAAPLPPTIINGVVVHHTVESVKKKKNRRVRIEGGAGGGSSQSFQSPSDIPDMNNEGVIGE